MNEDVTDHRVLPWTDRIVELLDDGDLRGVRDVLDVVSRSQPAPSVASLVDAVRALLPTVHTDPINAERVRSLLRSDGASGRRPARRRGRWRSALASLVAPSEPEPAPAPVRPDAGNARGAARPERRVDRDESPAFAPGVPGHGPTAPVPAEPETPVAEVRTAGPFAGVRSARAASRAAPRDVDLVVRALGNLEVTIGGATIDRWASGRGLAVFRYLVLNRERPIARERLMDLLWPWADPHAARNNLNVAMYGLRRSLREADPVADRAHVVFGDGCYRFCPELRVWSDVDELEAGLANARGARCDGRLDDAIWWLEHTVALRRGPLFEDDAAAEWYLGERQRIDERCADAWEQLATLRFGRGDVVGAADACRSLLELDNCCEGAHRLLMRTYVAQGKYHQVARQYADCVTTLLHELDIAPDPETTALFQELLDRRRHH